MGCIDSKGDDDNMGGERERRINSQPRHQRSGNNDEEEDEDKEKDFPDLEEYGSKYIYIKKNIYKSYNRWKNDW